MSGCFVTIQRGGVAVGVPSTTLSPAPPSTAMASSSQSKRMSPGTGSSRDQANSPIRTQLSPASAIRAASSSQSARGQCSG